MCAYRVHALEPTGETGTEFPFAFCAQGAATYRLSCASCGYIDIYKVIYGSWRFQCSWCHRWWALGLLKWPMGKGSMQGKAKTPQDAIFPTHSVSRVPWRAGDKVHKVMAHAPGASVGVIDDDNKDVSRNVTSNTGVAAAAPGRKRRKRPAASPADPAATTP